MDSKTRTTLRNFRSDEQIAGAAALTAGDPAIDEFADANEPAVADEGYVGPNEAASEHTSETASANQAVSGIETAVEASGNEPVEFEDLVPVHSAAPEHAAAAFVPAGAPQIPAQAPQTVPVKTQPHSNSDADASGDSGLSIQISDTSKFEDGVKDLTGGQIANGPIASVDENNLDDLLTYLNSGGDSWAPNARDGNIYLSVVFPDDASQIPEYYQIADNVYTQNLFGEDVVNFVAFGDDQKTTARNALEAWEDAANIIFIEVPPGSDADIYFYGQNFSSANNLSGQAYSSGVDETNGSRILVDAEEWVWSENGVGGQATWGLLHEIGHSLGFSHPSNYGADDGDAATYEDDADYVQDSTQYTVLSYFSGEETTADYNGNPWHPDTLQLHDHYVVQSVYGVNWDTRLGDTVYGYGSSLDNKVYDFDFNPAPVLTIWDGGGIDTLNLSEDASGVYIDLTPGSFSSTHGMTDNIAIAYLPEDAPAGRDGYIENAVGGAGNDEIYGNSQANQLLGLSGFDQLFGGAGDDLLDGAFGNDDLFGGAGEDTLFGGGGDDYLNGGFGVDDFDGGSGEDTVDFSYSNAGWTINLGEYSDNKEGVHGAAHYNGSVEDLIDIENVTTGTGNDIIVGSTADNLLKGGGGNDWLFGLAGNDRLEGQSGNDTFFGAAGDDDLFGGAGNDVFFGGDGDDLYIGATGWDTVDYADSNKDWTINLAFGTATNTQDSSYVLGKFTPDYIEVLSSIEEVQAGSGDDELHGDENVNALYGNEGYDTLFGYGGHDVLNGGDNNDHLDGGEGDDILVGGTGFDTASYHYATAAVLVDLAIAGQQDTSGAGADTLNEIENLEGSFHDDWLFGDANNNWLEGGAGDDVLTGREGADWLWGEHGDDILLGGEGLDLLYGGAGNDTASYTFASSSVQVDLSEIGFQETGGAGLDLLDGIENLAGSVHGDFLTGNDDGNTIDGFLGDDVINGLDGGDVLNGGFGNDVLIGGLGNDVLNGGAGGDWALYNVGSASGVVVDLTLGAQNTVGAGVDTLLDIENLRGSDFGDWLAGDDLSNEILGGGGGDWVFGRGGNDQIDGAQGNDFLFGNQGDDTLTGGSGNDTHWGGLGADTFVFGNNWGDDSIQDFEAGSDVLDFSAVAGVNGFHNLAYTETAGGLEIGFDGNSVTLANIALIDLTGGNFVL